MKRATLVLIGHISVKTKPQHSFSSSANFKHIIFNLLSSANIHEASKNLSLLSGQVTSPYELKNKTVARSALVFFMQQSFDI